MTRRRYTRVEAKKRADAFLKLYEAAYAYADSKLDNLNDAAVAYFEDIQPTTRPSKKTRSQLFAELHRAAVNYRYQPTAATERQLKQAAILYGKKVK